MKERKAERPSTIGSTSGAWNWRFMRKPTPKRKKSIVTGHAAREIIAQLEPESRNVIRGVKLGPQVELEFRRCYQNRIDGGYFTGGAELTAIGRKPAYEGAWWNRNRRSFHLRPGWGEKEIYRAVERAMGWWVEQARIIAIREEVYHLAEATKIDHAEIERLEAIHGVSDYAEMTPESAEIWLEALRKMPRKPRCDKRPTGRRCSKHVGHDGNCFAGPSGSFCTD